MPNRQTRGVAADINGNFSIQVGRNAKVRLKVSSLGYQAAELTVTTSGRKNISVMLEQQSVALKDFTVTAKYNDKTGSDATIGQEALEYIQPTSIQDIFQLLPGGKTGQNNMQSRSLISLADAMPRFTVTLSMWSVDMVRMSTPVLTLVLPSWSPPPVPAVMPVINCQV